MREAVAGPVLPSESVMCEVHGVEPGHSYSK